MENDIYGVTLVCKNCFQEHVINIEVGKTVEAYLLDNREECPICKTDCGWKVKKAR